MAIIGMADRRGQMLPLERTMQTVQKPTMATQTGPMRVTGGGYPMSSQTAAAGQPDVFAGGNPYFNEMTGTYQQPVGGTQYLFPSATSATGYTGLPTLTGIGVPTVSEGSAGDLSTGQILGGVGAIGAGGLLGGASGAAGIAGDLLNLYGAYSSGQAKENIARDVAQGYQTLGDTLSQQVQFKPFTVTSSTGAVQTTPEGGYSIGLTPQQQAMQDMLFGQAGGLFGQLGQGTEAREADVYNRIRALQTPAEERARLATEERMAAQGRLGLSSAAYGGSTPELMAQEQAVQQARQAASLAAIQQAQAEQAQLADMAGGLLTSSYLPQAQILNMLQPAVNLANIAGTQRQAGANILAEMAMNQMQAQAQAAIAQQQQRQGISQTLGGLLTSQQQGGGPSILEQLFGKVFSGGGGGASNNVIPELEALLNYQAPSYEYNPATPDINIGNLTYDPNASYGLLGGNS
jgi:hypothetical protein